MGITGIMVDTNVVDTELDRELSRRVRDICQQGYRLFDEGDYGAALRLFYTAWTQLPKPQTRWQEAGWILTALGDAYFAKGDFDNGRHALESALHCPRAQGNPVIHLRLGQCLYELGERCNASRQFRRVVEAGGEQLLRKEDPKYASALR